MRKFLIIVFFVIIGLYVHSQNLSADLNKANTFFSKTQSFSVEFKCNFYAASTSERPVMTKVNNAYRYMDRFYLWTQEREFIYKNGLSLTIDYNNGVIALQEDANPINEILSSTKLSNSIKNFKYDYKKEGESKVYTVNYPAKNAENIKKILIFLRFKDDFFQKMIVFYNSEVGSYKSKMSTTKKYKIMEIEYNNFKADPIDAKDKTDFDKYVIINGEKATLQSQFNHYALSDIRVKNKKNKKIKK